MGCRGGDDTIFRSIESLSNSVALDLSVLLQPRRNSHALLLRRHVDIYAKMGLVPMDNALLFRNREEWRTWLKENHDEKDQVWLLHYNKRSGKEGLALEEAVEEAICFGWIDGKLRKIDDEKYALRFSPRKSNSVWSIINKERAERMMKVGKMTEAGLVKIQEAKQSGYWDDAYTNKIRERLPPDLKKALLQNKRAWNNFHGFANTYRNMYIGWINSAKTDETRKKRINKVVEQSMQNKKYIFL